MNAAIVCDGKELEMYDVKQAGTSSLTAKQGRKGESLVRAFSPLGPTHFTNRRAESNHFAIQHFKITVSNNLL